MKTAFLKTEYFPQMFSDYTLSVEITGNSDKLQRAAAEGKEAVDGLGNAGTSAGEALEKALAATAIYAAVDKLIDMFKSAAQAVEDFEYGIAQVATIAGVNNVGKMSDDIMDLSNASGKATEELSLTAYSALSAGSAVENAVNDARIATELATAGFTDTNSALKVLKTATNAYGEEQDDLQHISDSLIQTQNLGVTTIAELASGMGVAIATASGYGVSLENLEAAYIATTKSGINTANSTTYISRMISELGDAGSDVAGILKNRTGKSFGQLMKSGYSLADVLQIIYEACGNDKEAMMQLWRQQNAGKASNAILSQGLDKFRQNLDAVTNSAGATEKAYEIMEDTTAHAHERMQTSIHNLSTVIGGTFNPVLKDVYNSVSDLVTGIQDFVEEHPAVVQMVAAMTAGLATLCVSVSAFVAGMKIAEGVVLLFTAALSVNPVFLFVAAIAAAGAAIGVLVATTRAGMAEAADAISPATTEMQRLTKSVEKANNKVEQSLEGMEDGFNSAKGSIEGNAEQAKKLTGRLEELSNKTNRTAGEQAEMENIVEKLNSSYPDMGLAIDDTTGKLNLSSQAIKDYIDNLKQIQTAQAYYDAASDAYRAVAEAEIAMTDAEANLKAAKEEGNRLEAERRELLNQSVDTMTTYNGKQMSVFEALNIVGQAIEQNKTAQQEANTALTEANTLSTEATDKADKYMEAYSNLTQAANDQTAALAAETEQQAASNQVAEEAAFTWENLSGSQQQAAADFANSVSDLVESTQTAISSQMNMFEEFKTGEAMATEDLLSNMQSQIDGVRNWESNLDVLADKGINQDLLQRLASMGPEGAAYVQTFVNMGPEELEKANSLWAESVNIRNMTDEWGQELISSGSENIRQSMGGLTDLMESSGADTAVGLANGILSKASESEDAAKEMGVKVIASVNTALGVASPSKKTHESGVYLDQGLINGIRDGAGGVMSAAQMLSMSVIQAAENELQPWRMQSAGYNFDRGLADGIYGGMGWVTSAAYDVAWSAVRAAESALGIHSPSTVARDKIGKYYGEGMALGITDMTSSVSKAVQVLISPMMHPINATAGSSQQRYDGFGGTTTNMNTTNVGGIRVNVNGAQGQDVNALADVVASRILAKMQRAVYV